MNNGAKVDNLGQLIISGIKGTTLLPEEEKFISDEKLGGIILYSHNFEAPAQLAELVNSIQKLREDYPLFIAANHEGGPLTQFKKNFTQFPTMMEIASLDSPKLVFEVHQIIAKELSACGINLCLSPCCDILTNPANKIIASKSYGQDAETVEKFIGAAIRGLQTSGILSCANHFPGQGNTSQDPNFELPVVKTSEGDLKSRELIPFIKASKSRVEFMMVGHLLVDSIDQKYPTSLSQKVYEFLRNETKFQKIVITDEMEMKAITDHYTTEEAATMAWASGADMLLYRSMDSASLALNALRNEMKKKKIRREDIQEKLIRVEKCKKANLSSYQPIYIPKIVESFNTTESKKLLQQLQSHLSNKGIA